MLKASKNAPAEQVASEQKVPEAVAPAPAEKKPAAKRSAAKKTAEKKSAAKKGDEVYVQFGGEEWSVAELTQRAKAAYLSEGHTAASVKKLAVYVKPEERKAYYVINDKAAGSIDI